MYTHLKFCNVNKILGKLFGKEAVIFHVYSVCFASDVHARLTIALVTAKMTQMSYKWRVFRDSNNPQHVSSFLMLYKGVSATRHAI